MQPSIAFHRLAEYVTIQVSEIESLSIDVSTSNVVGGCTVRMRSGEVWYVSAKTESKWFRQIVQAWFTDLSAVLCPIAIPNRQGNIQLPH